MNFGSMTWAIEQMSNRVDEIADESDYNSEDEQFKKQKSMKMNDVEKFLDSIDMKHLASDFQREGITSMHDLIKLSADQIHKIVGASQLIDRLISELQEYGKHDDMITSVLE